MYPRVQTTSLVTPAQPRANSKDTIAQITFSQDTHPRAGPRDAEVAREPPTEEALSVEIEKLCSATLAIDQTFYDIGRKLSDAVNDQNDSVDLYDTCYALQVQWTEHHLTYQSLLWRSREFSGEAQDTIDDFRELVLPSLRNPEMTVSEKQEIIREQIEVLQNTSQPSQNLSQEFVNFGRTLDKYIANFSRIVDGFKVEEKSKRVIELEGKLRSAKAAVEAINREVKELGWKLAGDVAVTGISLLLAFVMPKMWAKVADAAAIGIDCINVKNSTFRFLDLRRRSDLATKEYEVIKAEHDLEKAEFGQVVKLESTLYDASPLVQEVTMKLAIFANVWGAIRADILKLRNSLRRVEGSLAASKLFIQRIERLEKMYGYLSQALRHYQVTVLLT